MKFFSNRWSRTPMWRSSSYSSFVQNSLRVTRGRGGACPARSGLTYPPDASLAPGSIYAARNSRQNLRLPRRRPPPIGSPLHLGSTSSGVAIKPACKCSHGGRYRAFIVQGPIHVEAELHVAVAPDPGNSAILP